MPEKQGQVLGCTTAQWICWAALGAARASNFDIFLVALDG